MTILMPTCEEVTALLTDYEEGALGPLDWLGLKFHLALCPPCQAFLRTFDRTPTLFRQAWGEGPAPQAEQALASAMAALREGRLPRGPLHHPEPEAWATPGDPADPLLTLLLRIHLGQCPDCRAAHRPDLEPILLGPGAPPEALASFLSPGRTLRWSRWGLGGAQFAQVGQHPATRATLFLARLPGGRQAPPHEHAGRESCVVLSGRLQDGPAHLAPGDWISHGAGQRHAPMADPGEACWSLVHLEQPVRFLGWRRLFNLGKSLQSS